MFAGSFVTLAVKLCVWPEVTFAESGETATTIKGAGITVILAEEDFVVSETEVAVRVTAAGEGAEAGAV